MNKEDPNINQVKQGLFFDIAQLKMQAFAVRPPPRSRPYSWLAGCRHYLTLLLLIHPLASHAQRQPVTTITSFGPLEGSAPVGGLTMGPSSFIFGVTEAGGQNRDGSMFRFKGAAAPQWLTAFANAAPGPGVKPSGQLLRAPDGQFYGVTEQGGASGLGTIVRINSKGVGTLLASFTGVATGSRPTGWLVRDRFGSFYGVTREGGVSGHGTVFKLAKNGELTRLASFTNTSGTTPGRRPTGGLVLIGSDLYGVTEEGGTGGGHGVIFKITTAGDYSVVHTFTATGPRKPVGGLALGPDKLLYGVTETGSGAQTPGVIFRLNADNTLEVIKTFTGTDGATPGGALVLGANRTLYGTTRLGGAGNHGVVFSIQPDGTYTVLGEFTGMTGDRPGSQPVGRLLPRGPRLFGVTREGGAFNEGTLFEVTTTGMFKSLHNLAAQRPRQGAYPVGSLARRRDGSWFGTTQGGGEGNHGTVFRMAPNGRLTRLLSFTGNGGAFPGSAPFGGLIAGPDGRFYGTTSGGGSFGHGTVFAVTDKGVHTVLHEFNGTNGSTPQTPLILAADGRLVGTTFQGGPGNAGTVFAISTGGVFEKLADLNGVGIQPNFIMQATDGHFYGTHRPGSNVQGGLFKLTSSGTLTNFLTFTGASGAAPGSTPVGAPIQMPDGHLYGTTRSGGGTNRGTVYRVTLSGDHDLVVDLASGQGENPVIGLTATPDGWMYGVLASLQISFNFDSRGMVFRVKTDGTFERLKRWSAADGQVRDPSLEFWTGPLILAPSGQLFGTTGYGGRGSVYRSDGQGGPTGAGVIYRIDPRVPIPLPQVTVLPPTKLRNGNPFANRWEADLRARVNPRGFATSVGFGTVRSDNTSSGQGSVNLPAGNRAVTVVKSTETQQATGFGYTIRVTATNEFGSTVAEWGPLFPFNILPTVRDLVLQAPPPATPTEIYDVNVHTSDPDGAPRSLTLLSYNGAGSVTTDGSTVTYTGAPFTGSELVIIQVDDGGGARVNAHVTLISGAPATQPFALSSKRIREGTRLSSFVSTVHSFGPPTLFGDLLISPGKILIDQTPAGARREVWKVFDLTFQMGLPGSSAPGVALLSDGFGSAPGLPGVNFGSRGDFTGRTLPDFSKQVYAFRAFLFDGGVSAATNNNEALYVRVVDTATSTDDKFLLARLGDPAPNCGGNTFGPILGFLVPDVDDLPLVITKLRTGSGPAVTTANDTAVFGNDGTGMFNLLLRTGQTVGGGVIKSITLPQTVPGSADERRHLAGAVLLPQVVFTDNTRGILALLPNEAPALLLRTGQTDASGRELLAVRFADADVVGGDLRACLNINWRPGPGGVTLNDDSAILLADGTNQTIVAREGQEPPDITGAQFASFDDPVAGIEDDTYPYIAFLATVRGSGIGGANNRGLFVYPRDGMTAPHLLTRSGEPAPGTGGALFDRFETLASLDDLNWGVAFTATLRGPGVTKGNNRGLWAANDGGAPVLLFRTGRQIPVSNRIRTVKSFRVFEAVPNGTGQGRATSTGIASIALIADFTDGTSAALTISVP